MTESIKPDEVIAPDALPVQSQKTLLDAFLLLPNFIKLVGRLLIDPRVPRRAKISLGMAAAYVVSPIDFIPEVIPVIGWADDVLIMMLAIDSLINRAGPEIVEEHWDGDGDVLAIVREAIGISRSIVPRKISSVLDRLAG